MKESPLPLMPDMVRAYYEDRKTQTRRVLVRQPLDVLPCQGDKAGHAWVGLMEREPNRGVLFRCKYGTPGDRLWVREALVRVDGHVAYAYDHAVVLRDGAPVVWPWKRNTLSSRYMPRWACRSRAELIAVRVERIQDITPRDVVAEGVYHAPGEWAEDSAYEHLRRVFSALWDLINAKRGYDWASNPWVWALTFRRLV